LRNITRGVAQGDGNFCIGNNTGTALTTGRANTYIGNLTGQVGTNHQFNTAIGYGVFNTSSPGSYNVVIGAGAGGAYTGGTSVIIGQSAVSSGSASGSGVVAVGREALRALTSGSNTVAIGGGTGGGCTTFGNNVFIGAGAGSAATNVGNCIAIGYTAGNLNASNYRLHIDDSSTETPLIGGDLNVNKVGINTTNSTIDATLEITGTGSTSAARVFDASNSNDSTILFARGNNTVGINTQYPQVSLHIVGTDGIKYPAGTTAQRVALDNQLRGNSDVEGLEYRENGVWFRLGSSQAPTVAAGAGAGTGPTIAVTGSDLAGKVTLTTGTTSSAGALFTVTYGDALDASSNFYVTFSCRDDDCTDLALYISAESATAFTVSTKNAPVDATEYVINFHVGQ